MTTQIVTVNVTQTIAPAPSQLQRTGALVSQGATTLTPGTSSLLTQYSDLTSILAGSISITTMLWASSVVSVTTSAPHGIPNGDTILGLITGTTPTAYNGTFQITSTGANTFTYPLVASPGVVSVYGVWKKRE